MQNTRSMQDLLQEYKQNDNEETFQEIENLYDQTCILYKKAYCIKNANSIKNELKEYWERIEDDDNWFKEYLDFKTNEIMKQLMLNANVHQYYDDREWKIVIDWTCDNNLYEINMSYEDDPVLETSNQCPDNMKFLINNTEYSYDNFCETIHVSNGQFKEFLWDRNLKCYRDQDVWIHLKYDP